MKKLQLALAISILTLPAMAAQAIEEMSKKERPAALLGPDDSITILALNCEEISKEWRIGASGDVTFPLIGRQHLAGLTVEQAEQAIAMRLKRFVKDPQVTLYAGEQRSRPVTVSGAVEKPGRYQLAPGSTLFDALIMAGGPRNAGSRLSVRRKADGEMIGGASVKTDKEGAYTLAEFELREVTDGPEGPGRYAQFALQPYDVITVSFVAAPRFIHIVGEVNRPGSVELVLQDSVSVMKLIAVAGGLSRTASPSNALIMHFSPEGHQTSTAYVDLRKVLTGKVKDLELMSGDILMIPSSKAKVVAQMFTGTALSAGLSTAIFTLARF